MTSRSGGEAGKAELMNTGQELQAQRSTLLTVSPVVSKMLFFEEYMTRVQVPNK